jgi:hypothetical protein
MSSVISMFLGIIIRMYWEADESTDAHIHAEYLEHHAVFSVPDGKILDGSLPRRQRNFVRAWISLHEDELIANWELITTNEQLFKIDPLK